MLMAFSHKICTESAYTDVQSLFKQLESRQGQLGFSFESLPCSTQDPDAQKHLPCGALGARKEAVSGEQRSAQGRPRCVRDAPRAKARSPTRGAARPDLLVTPPPPPPPSAAASQVIPGT